jgi:lysophospholipase L1-like esterase
MNYFWSKLVVVLMLLLLSLPSLSQTVVIAVGDSITSGYPEIENANGCHACGGYAPYLQSLLNSSTLDSTVYNFGIAGDRAQWATVPSTKLGSNQIPRAFAAHSPDFMLYLFGTNDLYHHSPETIISYIRIGMNAILDGGAAPIIATLLPDARSNNNNVKEIPRTNSLLRDMLEEEGVTMAEMYYAPSTQNPVGAWDSLMADDLHPGPSGRSLMAGVWSVALLAKVAKIKANGALSAAFLLLLD